MLCHDIEQEIIGWRNRKKWEGHTFMRFNYVLHLMRRNVAIDVSGLLLKSYLVGRSFRLELQGFRKLHLFSHRAKLQWHPIMKADCSKFLKPMMGMNCQFLRAVQKSVGKVCLNSCRNWTGVQAETLSGVLRINYLRRIALGIENRLKDTIILHYAFCRFPAKCLANLHV